jgi:argininosuccinate lyase
MKKSGKTGRRQTIVGKIDAEVLQFTAGRDRMVDLHLAVSDCIGTAAHVTMLSRVPNKPRLIKPAEKARLVAELVCIISKAKRGKFKISVSDQDVHLAVERVLTQKCGDLGRKVHAARSRNDQIAVDLRLFAKEQLLDLTDEALALVHGLLKLAGSNISVPMVGRTHMQPAMISSVGLWAGAHAESLLDDLALVSAAYEFNNKCPLGSAAGYGVPLKIDKDLTARLLGFKCSYRNALYAGNARGKCESIILGAVSQIMLSLSRLAEDIILYSMPEFAYFGLPSDLCTGSSIMPQKQNPDVLELIRARTSTVLSCASAVAGIIKGLPSGYSRDLQETKEPFINGIATTRSCLRILTLVIKKLKIDEHAMKSAFTPQVLAADRALEMSASGVPFRLAYDRVKADLADLEKIDPALIVAKRPDLSTPQGVGLNALATRHRSASAATARNRKSFRSAIAGLLGVKLRKGGLI